MNQSVDMAETPSEINFSSSQVLQIKCGECKLVCSVAPVSEQAGSFYCGRCRPEGTPNRRFEEAAKNVLFPCIFGCGFHSFSKDALEHEGYCKNRTVVCPFFNCTSTNTLQDLHQHIIGCHKEYHQETPAIYHCSLTSSSTVELNCIEVDKFVFLLFVRFNREADIVNLKYNVCFVWPQNSERSELHNMQLILEVEVLQTDTKVIKLIECKNIVNYYDRSYCTNCFIQSCDKILHQSECNLLLHDISFNVEDDSDVDISYTIEEYKKVAVCGRVPDALECPMCKDYMMTKIFLCERGHSFCHSCNERQLGRVCLLCLGKTHGIRNFAMERLAQQINVPCRNIFAGCKFVGLAANVMVHEKSCKYSVPTPNPMEVTYFDWT
ncbi:unnamed protein product [Callosobruchus maculatus]|uniref:E3 ubiquitin-protein ligase Sina-like RING finger domain-containing protein n=1 Tax=Callosobruchus maculatus TaxID=64391 RepID=A0A653C6A4_CALMS|nr:unnamed protein product [Callosobruchus maculatus]